MYSGKRGSTSQSSCALILLSRQSIVAGTAVLGLFTEHLVYSGPVRRSTGTGRPAEFVLSGTAVALAAFLPDTGSLTKESDPLVASLWLLPVVLFIAMSQYRRSPTDSHEALCLETPAVTAVENLDDFTRRHADAGGINLYPAVRYP